MISGKSMTTEEYRKLDRLSASDIRTFITDRKKFFKEKVQKEKPDEDEYNKSFLIGDIVHTKLLEPDTFDNKYFMSRCQDVPTGNMLSFTEALIKWTIFYTDENGTVTVDFKDIAEAAYKDSGFKWKFETVIEKFKGSNSEVYYDDLIESKIHGKKLVTIGDITLADRIVETLRTHENSRDIVNQVSDDRYIVIHETQLEFEVDGVLMKAMLDKVVIDRHTKTIQIYDYKIVWDNVKFYKEYYLYRRADIQAYIYWVAVKSESFEEVIGLNVEDFEFLPPIFITADSTNSYPPILYKLTEDHLTAAFFGFEENGRDYKGIFEILKELSWHQENGRWFETPDLIKKKGLVDLKYKF